MSYLQSNEFHCSSFEIFPFIRQDFNTYKWQYHYGIKSLGKAQQASANPGLPYTYLAPENVIYFLRYGVATDKRKTVQTAATLQEVATPQIFKSLINIFCSKCLWRCGRVL